jgi:hypothetical protein
MYHDSRSDPGLNVPLAQRVVPRATVDVVRRGPCYGRVTQQSTDRALRVSPRGSGVSREYGDILEA